MLEAKSHPGWISLKSFALGAGLIMCHIVVPGIPRTMLVHSAVYGITGLCLVKQLVGKEESFKPSGMTVFQVQSRAFFLGWALSCGVAIIVSNYSTPLGLYICLLSCFHYSEFFVTSLISPDTLSLDSYLLNHGKEYGAAALMSLLEFTGEFLLVPRLKDCSMVMYLGLGICVGGEMFRKIAMLTASKNFTHLIQENKGDGQYLVTKGPYAICRHPGYAGWFWWSVGTQLVMINPICTIGYCIAVYKFFKDRIYYEEICLLSFFGLEYVKYQKNVKYTGVPFVEGYIFTSSISTNIEQDTDSSSSDDLFQRIEHDDLKEH